MDTQEINQHYRTIALPIGSQDLLIQFQLFLLPNVTLIIKCKCISAINIDRLWLVMYGLHLLQSERIHKKN